ncbi:MAG: MBL fold metallo-hydrolase [Methanophagales archaeon ANME-1-THS]|nr:MAG: MBL fold metallo-hydrolase [Methanophagales archaeon ANME-1-THS]
MWGKQENELIFLGTAGARFVMITQLRSSAGTVMSLKDTTILIDPGPGTLVKFTASKPKLNPAKLDAILLTHKHLDHSNDVNVMIEAMTEGGFKPKGILLAPNDALTDAGDAVVLNYYKGLVDKIEVLEEGGSYAVGNLELHTPKRHVHGIVETYGLNIKVQDDPKTTVSFIADTLYFDGLERYYEGEVLVLNVAMYKRREGVDHLSVEDAKRIIEARSPKVAILTHFGMTMLRNKPWEIAKQLSRETGVNVIAARDGMRFDLNPFI